MPTPKRTLRSSGCLTPDIHGAYAAPSGLVGRELRDREQAMPPMQAGRGLRGFLQA